MVKSAPRHGSNSGYKAEIAAGNKSCERCRKAHNLYAVQFTRKGKALGVKYSSTEVIDHLWTPELSGGRARVPGTGKFGTSTSRSDTPTAPATGAQGGVEITAPTETGPNWTARLRGLVAPGTYPDDATQTQSNDYVEDTDIPDWLHPVDPDPEPSGEWSNVSDPVDAGDFVITADAMEKIESNLGTYLSVVGMTVEMIDPYCGPILAKNFDTVVKKWAVLISKYPSAAQLFLDEKGGVLFAWIAAIQATWPVIYAIYEHHLSRTVKVDNGVVYRVQKSPDGAKRFDPTMPPTPDSYEYSAV
jgi:hypothetical protein